MPAVTQTRTYIDESARRGHTTFTLPMLSSTTPSESPKGSNPSARSSTGSLRFAVLLLPMSTMVLIVMKCSCFPGRIFPSSVSSRTRRRCRRARSLSIRTSRTTATLRARPLRCTLCSKRAAGRRLTHLGIFTDDQLAADDRDERRAAGDTAHGGVEPQTGDDWRGWIPGHAKRAPEEVHCELHGDVRQPGAPVTEGLRIAAPGLLLRVYVAIVPDCITAPFRDAVVQSITCMIQEFQNPNHRFMLS